MNICIHFTKNIMHAFGSCDVIGEYVFHFSFIYQ